MPFRPFLPQISFSFFLSSHLPLLLPPKKPCYSQHFNLAHSFSTTNRWVPLQGTQKTIPTHISPSPRFVFSTTDSSHTSHGLSLSEPWAAHMFFHTNCVVLHPWTTDQVAITSEFFGDKLCSTRIPIAPYTFSTRHHSGLFNFKDGSEIFFW